MWRGSFSVHGDTPRDAYAIIKKDAELVRQYLEENQVADDENDIQFREYFPDLYIQIR